MNGNEVTVAFLATQHSSAVVAPAFFTTLTWALEQSDDGRSIEDFNIIGALSADSEGGWDSVRMMASYQELDTLVLFGKTASSVGLSEAEELKPVNIRLRNQLTPVRCMKLPSPLSSWWGDEDNIRLAAAALKPLLGPPGKVLGFNDAPHLVFDKSEFN